MPCLSEICAEYISRYSRHISASANISAWPTLIVTDLALTLCLHFHLGRTESTIRWLLVDCWFCSHMEMMMMRIMILPMITIISHGDGKPRRINSASSARQVAGDPLRKKIWPLVKKNILDSELSQVHIHLIWSNLQNIIGFAPVVFLGRGMFQARLRHHFWSKKYENVSTSVVGRSSESNLRLLPVLLLSMVNHGTVSVQHGHLATPESTAHRHRWWQSQT